MAVATAIAVVGLAVSGALLVRGSTDGVVRVHPRSVATDLTLIESSTFDFFQGATNLYSAAIGDGIVLLATNLRADQEPIRAALYRPGPQTIEPIAVPPFTAPLSQPSLVWTGKRLLVIGVACLDRSSDLDDEFRCYPGIAVGAAYDPATDSWQAIPLPDDLTLAPGNPGGLAAAVGWTGRAAVFQFFAATSARGATLRSFDPQSQSWQVISPPPGSPTIEPYVQSCVAGGSLVSTWMTPVEEAATGAAPVRGVVIRALDTDSQTWREVPDPPLSFSTPSVLGPRVRCGDGTLYVGSAELAETFIYDLSKDAWRTTAPAPRANLQVDGREIPITWDAISFDGSRYVFWLPTTSLPEDGPALAYLPAKDTWVQAPSPADGQPSGPTFAWFEGRAYFFGTSGHGPGASTGLLEWDPPHS